MITASTPLRRWAAARVVRVTTSQARSWPVWSPRSSRDDIKAGWNIILHHLPPPNSCTMDTLRKYLWGWCRKRSCRSSPILSQRLILSDNFVAVMAIRMNCLHYFVWHDLSMGTEPQKGWGKMTFLPHHLWMEILKLRDITQPQRKGKVIDLNGRWSTVGPTFPGFVNSEDFRFKGGE